MIKTGIYVGSFNPPHLGHISIIKHLLDKKIVDEILIVPVSNSNKKLASKIDRYNMLKLINIENTKVIKDALETDSYFNYHLLNKIKEKYQIKHSYIIMGMDNLNKMPNWDNYENIIKENKIICIKRNKEYPIIEDNIIFIDNISSISSTIIRETLNKDYLTKEIYNYIIENNLYRKNDTHE